MEDLVKTNSPYSTASHNEELDFIFNQDSEDFDEIIFENKKDLFYELKTYFRLFRKKISYKVREKMQKNFTNIMYLTLDCPPFIKNSYRLDLPLEFIYEMRKQYPDNDIRVMVPIINIDEDFTPVKKLSMDIDGRTRVLEKTSIKFEFFMQNKVQEAIVYKFPKDKTNIQVYGIYSPSFSWLSNINELSRLQYLAPFLKSARIAIKKMYREDFVVDIVHCENIPYYLGGEFEYNHPIRVKVLQMIKDFTQVDVAKPEAFWAFINLADKNSMKKLCSDSVVKKCVANLFNLHNTKRFYQMRECLRFIYKNYYKFRKYVDKGEDIEENIIFNRLNARVLQLFPNISYGEDLYFNPMMFTLKRCDYWATFSKTYYKEIFENPLLSGKMFKLIEKNKEKSSYLAQGCAVSKYPLEDTRDIYQCFNLENFRDLRGKNKQALIKEFSLDRVKTNFVDPTLFKNEDYKIAGSLDSFYDAPLIFANPSAEVFANGVDILFNTILKLFELHKNIQVVIAIKDGFSVNFVKTWVDFLAQNKYLNGRWVFIDGDINIQKFYAAADMTFMPRRANLTNPEQLIAMHYGCVPVVARSGFLNDSVSDIFEDMTLGCGFKTRKGLLTDENTNELFLAPVMKALNLYQNNPASWNLLIKNCLSKNVDWNFKILEKYNKIYQELL